jgi:aldose 1-epimerase
MRHIHTLDNGLWQVGILPETGASLAFGRVRAGDRWLDVLRPTPSTCLDNPELCASFPMIPWSNRLRDGRFTFRGIEYQLRPNADDGSAMHGVARDLPWTVEHADSAAMVVSLDTRHFEGVNFPWRFSARLTFELAQGLFKIITQVRNEDATPMPAGFGHHPYFLRRLVNEPDGPDVHLYCACSQAFLLEAGIPTGPAIPVPPQLDFRTCRPLGDKPLNDCLTGCPGGLALEYVNPGLGLAIWANPDIFKHVVLYAPPDKPYFAVEPVTNANDGFNLHEKEIAGSGVFVLEPGEEREGYMRLELAKQASR